jgi:hypothetical protein
MNFYLFLIFGSSPTFELLVSGSQLVVCFYKGLLQYHLRFALVFPDLRYSYTTSDFTTVSLF